MKNDIKILCTAFNGKENSSKLLLDKMKCDNKLYLKNSFTNSVNALEKELKNNNYDLIISFGQAPLEVDSIQIETKGRQAEVYETQYNYENLKRHLARKYKVKISSDAGNYLCNNLYYHGLKLISEKYLRTKMIFIHIPKKKNITDIEVLAHIFDDYFNVSK